MTQSILVKLIVDDVGGGVNVCVEGYEWAPHFTMNKENGVWGAAPDDTWPTWVTACLLAGLDPDDRDAVESALNSASVS